MVTLPRISLAISSSAGPIILHGPHHSAQKSTTIGPLDPITSDLKLASVTLTVDMSDLSRTRARDNTRRVTIRKVRTRRACVKPRGRRVRRSLHFSNGWKADIRSGRLNDAGAPMADKGARLNTKQNPFSFASKCNHRAWVYNAVP